MSENEKIEHKHNWAYEDPIESSFDTITIERTCMEDGHEGSISQYVQIDETEFEDH